MSALLLFAAVVTPVAETKFKLRHVSVPALPYVIAYMSCYQPRSDLAQKLMRQMSLSEAQLPAYCLKNRGAYFDAALKALRKTGTTEMIDEERRLERNFAVIEKNFPVADPQAPAENPQ